MSTTSTTAGSPARPGGSSGPEGPESGRPRPWARALLLRLHFYVGVFVGPFLIVAALTGALYALSPQLEKIVYADELNAHTPVVSVPLETQIDRAQESIGTDAAPSAVRPGQDGATTRVMFADPELAESESRAVFVDPSTGNITGELTVYGSSGALPLRTWLSNLHRSLLLGEPGRVYSELAASWLWVLALSGAALWLARWRRTKPERRRRALLLPDTAERNKYRLTLNRHSAVGIWLALGFLFLSATGLTWSAHAGANVAELRTALGWTTPELDTTGGSGVGADAPTGHEGHGAHAEHGATTTNTGVGSGYDDALATAREAGIDSALVEITPPASDDQAWSVTEMDRSWPTQVDAVAVDPTSHEVLNEVRFEDYGLAAKLTRWGIDAHMGLLFGLANQLVLFVVALGLAVMTVWSYLMWWRRRPGFGLGRTPSRGVLRRAPWWAVLSGVLAAAAIGVFLPLLGISLLGFLSVDVVVGLVQRRRTRQLA